MQSKKKISRIPNEEPRSIERKGGRRLGHQRGGAAAITRRDARLWRSARSAGRGRLRRALRGYLGLIEEAPDDLQARNRAGDLLFRIGEVARALELFTSVAEGLRDAGFEDKAAAIDQKILRLAPQDEGARRALIAWYARRGHRGDAQRLETATPEMSPRKPPG